MWRIRKFIKGIKNLIYYFKVIWNDNDWDYSFITDLLYVKLNKTYQRYNNKRYFVGQEDNTVKPLRICVEILNRSKNNFYWNTDNWNDIVDNCEERNRRILFAIMSKYLSYWWD